MTDSTALLGTLDRAQGNARTRVWRHRLEIGLLGVGLLAPLVFLGHHVYSDAAVRYQALTTLLLHGTLDQSKYSLIGPLFSTPIWLIGGWLHLPHRGVGVYNWCVFTAGVGALYILLRTRLEPGLLHRFLLLLIAGSMFPFHLTNYYGEVFTAVCVAVGLVAIQVGHPRLGWPAVVLGVANTPATLVALGLVVLVRVHQTKRVRNVWPVIAAAAVIAAENWIRRGSPFATSYESGFGLPFIGLISILFSFGKGLIFFTPGLFLPIRRALAGVAEPARRLLASTYALWIAFAVGLVLVYSPWWDWSGDWFWGPRFFLFASIPAALVLAVRLHRRETRLGSGLLTFGVLVLSVWVDVNGAVYGDYALFNICTGHNYALQSTCWYLPGYSVLWYPLSSPQPLNWMSFAYVAYCVAVLAYLAAPLVRDIVSIAMSAERRAVRQFVA